MSDPAGREWGFCIAGIDNDTLWSIVVTDVPALLIGLRALVQAGK